VNILTRGKAKIGGLAMPGGTFVRKIVKGSISVNPPNLTAVTAGTVSLTITGVRVGDMVFMTPNSAFEAALVYVGARVTADDTVVVDIHNPSAGTVDGAALSWDYVWFDLT